MNTRARQFLPPLREAAVAERILADVCAEFNVGIGTLTNSRRRTANVAEARHTAVFLVRRHTFLNWHCVGACFQRTQAAVRYANTQVAAHCEVEPQTRLRIEKLSALAMRHREDVFALQPRMEAA